MLPAEILRKKRDKNELSPDEIKFLVEGITQKKISEAQAAAFLMASCINGLSARETAALTFAMAHSGKKFSWSEINKPIIDKHSTGGVGDKISLLLVPIVSCCDIAVPMISGRGLGHTGGTVDKLESIAGFRMDLSDEKLFSLMKKNSCFMISQTPEIAPADKILYQLRDVTGTVESAGLITASILSKKFAEGLDGLVMDIKVGSGAFMQTFGDAKILAESMIGVAREAGLGMKILFTRMDEPLGYKIGNWLEIEETEDCLRGNCPDDLRFVTEKLALAMLELAFPNEEKISLGEKISSVWNSGEALQKFYSMISDQGGDLETSRKNYSPAEKFSLRAPTDGILTKINTREIGIAAIQLGAGRLKQDDAIDFSAGIILRKKIGDEVRQGEEIAVFQGKNFSEAEKTFLSALTIEKNLSRKNFSEKKFILEEWTA